MLGIITFPQEAIVSVFEGSIPDQDAWACGSSPLGKSRRWLHNETYASRQENIAGGINRITWTPTNLNDSGIYECQVIDIAGTTEQDLNATVLSSCTITLTVISK